MMQLHYRGAILRTHFLDGIKHLDFAQYFKSIVGKNVREGKTVVRVKFPRDLNPIYPVYPIGSGTREHPEKVIKLEEKFYFVKMGVFRKDREAAQGLLEIFSLRTDIFS